MSDKIADLDGVPMNTIIKVTWEHESEPCVLRKVRNRIPSLYGDQWEVVSDNSGNDWAGWEVELVAESVEIVALGREVPDGNQ